MKELNKVLSDCLQMLCSNMPSSHSPSAHMQLYKIWDMQKSSTALSACVGNALRTI